MKSRNHNDLTIISGGQTGVDRGALDAALASGIAIDGWCPEGRLAENGKIPAHYPLRELAGGNYASRTRQNVIDSDATIIFRFARIDKSPGTELTLKQCITHTKSYLLIDAETLSEPEAVRQILEFISAHNVRRLNIAGPRESQTAAAYKYSMAVVRGVINNSFD